MEMTDNDKKLIAEAEAMPCTEWAEIAEMESRADTEEARERIRQIAINKYHREEAKYGYE